MRVLGIESSCDESALALFDTAVGVRGQWISSQISLHREYGGVVPDLAGREHLRNFPELLHRMEAESADASFDRIAVTLGPGLAGCLAMGISLARSLRVLTGAPVVGVNHLRAHVFSPFIPLHEEAPSDFENRLRALLPHVGLLVSGGNTLLVRIDRDLRPELLGGTVDDAAGEALDKGAKLLGLPYPGGPEIECLAREGDPRAFAFPRAFSGRRTLKFSFSGLKTSLRYRLAEMTKEEIAARRTDLCASYQEAVLAALADKTAQALETSPAVSLGLSGGVANNASLRDRLSRLAAERGIPFHAARPEHSGDNGAMIAFAACYDRAGVVPEEAPAFRMDPSWEPFGEGA